MEQHGGWTSARKSLDKGLLKNIIRHTDAHNKIQEQNDMWKQWELKKQYRERDYSYKHDKSSRGYMRSDTALSSAARKESQKWNRILQEYEETRTDRWGHSGYKELYPDEFKQENDSEMESDESETNGKGGRKNEKSKEKQKKKSKKSRKNVSDSSDSNSETERKHRKKIKDLGDDIKTRDHRKRDKKAEPNIDSKTERHSGNKLKRKDSDSDDNNAKTSRKQSKKLDSDFKIFGRERKLELNQESNGKRLDGENKSHSKYTDNDMNYHDKKRKIKSADRPSKEGRRDKKQRSESSERNTSEKRSVRKRNTEDLSRKANRTFGSSYSPRKKIKH